MIIPGLTPAGAQQDVFKPARQTKASAVAGVPNESLSELPVDSEAQQQQPSGQSQAEARDAASQSEHAGMTESAGADRADLPRKGLMIDIRA